METLFNIYFSSSKKVTITEPVQKQDTKADTSTANKTPKTSNIEEPKNASTFQRESFMTQSQKS